MKKRVKHLLHRAGLLSPAEKAYFDLRLVQPHRVRRELELSVHGLRMVIRFLRAS